MSKKTVKNGDISKGEMGESNPSKIVQMLKKVYKFINLIKADLSAFFML